MRDVAKVLIGLPVLIAAGLTLLTYLYGVGLLVTRMAGYLDPGLEDIMGCGLAFGGVIAPWVCWLAYHTGEHVIESYRRGRLLP